MNIQNTEYKETGAIKVKSLNQSQSKTDVHNCLHDIHTGIPKIIIKMCIYQF